MREPNWRTGKTGAGAMGRGQSGGVTERQSSPRPKSKFGGASLFEFFGAAVWLRFEAQDAAASLVARFASLLPFGKLGSAGSGLGSRRPAQDRPDTETSDLTDGVRARRRAGERRRFPFRVFGGKSG